MATSLKLIVFVIWSSIPETSLMKTSVTCDPGMYYDFAIGRCDLCDTICDYAEIQGTVLECATKCPDFTSSYKSAESADTLSKQQTVNAVTTTSTTTTTGSCGEERRTITMLLLALCGVSVLLILMMVVIIVLTFKRARQQQTGYSVARTTEPLIRRDGHAQCTVPNGQVLKQPGTLEPKPVASERVPVAQFPMSSI